MYPFISVIMMLFENTYIKITITILTDLTFSRWMQVPYWTFSTIWASLRRRLEAARVEAASGGRRMEWLSRKNLSLKRICVFYKRTDRKRTTTIWVRLILFVYYSSKLVPFFLCSELGKYLVVVRYVLQNLPIYYLDLDLNNFFSARKINKSINLATTAFWKWHKWQLSGVIFSFAIALSKSLCSCANT